MGCYSYMLEGQSGEIRFSNQDENCKCLCDSLNEGETFTPDLVRSLAILGAAVVLRTRDDLPDDWTYLPEAIPQHIRDGIDSKLKQKP